MQKRIYCSPIFGILAALFSWGTLLAQAPAPPVLARGTEDENKRPATISPGRPLPIVFAQLSKSGENIIIAGQISGNFPGRSWDVSPESGFRPESVFRLRLNTKSVHAYDLAGKRVEDEIVAQKLKEKTPVLFFYGTEPPDDSLGKLSLFHEDALVLHVPIKDEKAAQKMGERIEYLPKAKMPTPPGWTVLQADEAGFRCIHSVFVLQFLTKMLPYTISYERDGQTVYEQRTKQVIYGALKAVDKTAFASPSFDEAFGAQRPTNMLFPHDKIWGAEEPAEKESIDESYRQILRGDAPVLRNNMIEPVSKKQANTAAPSENVVAFIPEDAEGQCGPDADFSELTLSSDEKFIVTSGTPHLMDATTGKTVRKLNGTSERVVAPRFSSDGTLILAEEKSRLQGRGSTLKMWSVETGELLAEHKAKVTDGRYLKEGTLGFLPGEKQVLYTMTNPSRPRPVGGGKVIRTPHYDDITYIWNFETGSLEETKSRDSGNITKQAISPDGRYVLKPSFYGDYQEDGIAKIIDRKTGKTVRNLSGHESWVYAAVYSPDGKYIATGCGSCAVGAVRIWDAKTGRLIRRFGGFKEWVPSLTFFSDSRKLLAGSCDGTANVYDVVSGKVIHSMNRRLRKQAVTASPDGKYILVGEKNGTVTFLDSQTGEKIKQWSYTFTEGKTPCDIYSLSYSRDGKYLIVGVNRSDDQSFICDAVSGKRLRNLEDFIIGGIHTTPDNKYAVYNNKQYDFTTGKILGTYGKGYSSSVSPDGKYVVTENREGGSKGARTAGNGNVTLWNLTERTVIRQFEGLNGTISSVLFSPDGKIIVAASEEEAAFWEMGTGKLVRKINIDNGERLISFSKDGNFILTVVFNARDINVRDAKTGKIVRKMDGHNPSFLPDGRIVSVNADGFIQVFSVSRTGEFQSFTSRENR